jgi:hypothetical protein
VELVGRKVITVLHAVELTIDMLHLFIDLRVNLLLTLFPILYTVLYYIQKVNKPQLGQWEPTDMSGGGVGKAPI